MLDIDDGRLALVEGRLPAAEDSLPTTSGSFPTLEARRSWRRQTFSTPE
jgi:hypothetical protein